MSCAVSPVEAYESVAYVYDGSLEGLLSAIFAAYANHADPEDVVPSGQLQPRLGQQVSAIETNVGHAERVARTLRDRCGWKAYCAVRDAALYEGEGAGTAAYRFVRYALDQHKRRDCAGCRKRPSCPGARGQGGCPRLRGRALSDITHPAVEPLHRIQRAVSSECEHVRQFARFEHLRGQGVDVWFARCNPKAAVVPLVMDHFVDRFNVQPFILYDEAHGMAGVYEGTRWYLVRTEGLDELALPAQAEEERLMQAAWRRFYHSVAVESRYNPELRRHFMPKRFWRNITEMQEEIPTALAQTA